MDVFSQSENELLAFGKAEMNLRAARLRGISCHADESRHPF